MNADVSLPSAGHAALRRATAEGGGTHRAWTATGRSDVAAGLRRARRHSRFVRFLRFGIPLSIVAAGGIYYLASILNPLAMLPNLQNAGLALSGSQITMDQPRVAGFTRDGRSYELTAAMAMQDLKTPNLVELKQIRGKVQLQDGQIVEISADLGSYDTKAELITLRDNVVVTTSDGVQARMAVASVDAKTGRVVSREAVEVVTEAGRLQARTMEVSEGGGIMKFQGGVTMDFNSPQPAAAPTGSVPPAARPGR